MKKYPLRYILLLGVVYCISCSKFPPADTVYNRHTTAVFNPDKVYGTVIDVDGNVYRTIVIGNQTWMAENLRVTHYRNGDEISHVPDSAKWERLVTGAYCTYKNTFDTDTIATYGLLYNWYAVSDSRGLAPAGWRIPSLADWETLIEYLGGYDFAGAHLKEAGSLHWHAPVYADNSSGFTALPGGWRNWRGYYWGTIPGRMGIFGGWWISDKVNFFLSPSIYCFNDKPEMFLLFDDQNNGYSVRCIKE